MIPPLTQTLQDLEREFEGGVFLKLENEAGQIVGSVRGRSESDTLHIGKLMVRPDSRGQELGSRLLKEIERVCPHARYELFTSTKSERNIRLYERLGYARFKERDMGKGLRFVYLRKNAKNAG